MVWLQSLKAHIHMCLRQKYFFFPTQILGCVYKNNTKKIIKYTAVGKINLICLFRLWKYFQFYFSFLSLYNINCTMVKVEKKKRKFCINFLDVTAYHIYNSILFHRLVKFYIKDLSGSILILFIFKKKNVYQQKTIE